MREFRSYGSVPRLQQNFGRTWPMTLKLSGTYSSISAPSSPNSRKAPPEPGQQACLAKSRCIFPSTALSPVRDLRASGRGSRLLHTGQLGRRHQPAAESADRPDPRPRFVRGQDPCRRHARPPACYGSWTNQDGKLWTCVRDDRPARIEMAPAVWSAYSIDRRGEHPQQHSGHFQGTLQADVSKDLMSWSPFI